MVFTALYDRRCICFNLYDGFRRSGDRYQAHPALPGLYLSFFSACACHAFQPAFPVQVYRRQGASQVRIAAGGSLDHSPGAVGEFQHADAAVFGLDLVGECPVFSIDGSDVAQKPLEQVEEMEDTALGAEIFFMQHALYDGDLAVVVVWMNEVEPQKTREGLLVAERLKELGSVDHAVWVPAKKSA